MEHPPRVPQSRRRKPPGSALLGYVRISELPHSFSIAWRWRYDVRWRAGSVQTREEAETLRLQIRETLARGEEPGPLPRYEVPGEREADATTLSPAELAERRALIAKQTAPDAERCPRCHLLAPCDPCPASAERRREARSARREF